MEVNILVFYVTLALWEGWYWTMAVKPSCGAEPWKYRDIPGLIVSEFVLCYQGVINELIFYPLKL